MGYLASPVGSVLTEFDVGFLLGMLIENQVFSLKTENRFYFFGNRFSNLFYLSFSSWKLHKSHQMSDKINSHILFNVECLWRFLGNGQIWPAKKPYYKDLLVLKFKFLWRAAKPKTGLKPVFNNQKLVWQKTELKSLDSTALTKWLPYL